MNAHSRLVVALLCTLSTASFGQSKAELEDRRTSFGAFAAPAVLPSGGTAAYAFAGVPEVGAGYRHGLGLLELEGRLALNYFSLSLGLEGIARYSAYSEGKVQVAPSLGLGLVLDTGTRYIDRHNFGYVGLRLRPGATVSYRAAETASVLGDLTVPIDLSLSPWGGNRFAPMIGGGGELYLGDDITAGALAHVGLDVIKQPLGVPQTRFAFSLRVGLGYRFF